MVARRTGLVPSLLPELPLMSDWVWFGSLAFPAFFRPAFLGTIVWFFLRYAYRRFSLDRWFWHTGLVELSLLVICYALTSWILNL